MKGYIFTKNYGGGIFMRWTIILSGILILCLGCGTSEKAPISLITDPKIDKIEGSSDFQIYGKIVFDGNSDYLPQRLKEKNSNPEILLKYSFQLHYGNKELSSTGEDLLIGPVFPLLFAMGGASLGKNDVLAIGRLEIIKENQIIKTYRAAARTVQERGLWVESDTQSELRKKCLLEVRDNIDKQLQNDKEYLQDNVNN